jgi:hypothetical protein
MVRLFWENLFRIYLLYAYSVRAYTPNKRYTTRDFPILEFFLSSIE